MLRTLMLAAGLFMAFSAFHSTEAYARDPRWYCPPTYSQPRYVAPVREPNWYRYRESYGGFRTYDYHEFRGEYSSQKDWRSWGYNANYGHGQGYDEHFREDVRYPGHTMGYGNSPIFP